jgi:hypothetical protein
MEEGLASYEATKGQNNTKHCYGGDGSKPKKESKPSCKKKKQCKNKQKLSLHGVKLA